jgi:hypothetical protein
MTPRPRTNPEPNFKALVAEDHLPQIVITGHALQRFVERLQPGIPGADPVAEAMVPLEALKDGTRTGPQQGELRDYRAWMAQHVQPYLVDSIRCEGFWTTQRPRWCRSGRPADGWLQVGGLCLFPIAIDGGRISLITCECGKANGRDIPWDMALDRGYTLMPKPYIDYAPQMLRAPSWTTIASLAWRTRAQHKGLLAAFRAERSKAIEDTQRQNERAAADLQAAKDTYHVHWENAQRTFRERHR